MITKQKGTYDIYGDLAKKRMYVNDVLNALCEKFNYGYVETPVFEASELFHRGVGDTSDIVTKETYDFKDRGDRSLTLRPEGTAGVVRWFVENKLYGNMTDPVKVYYNQKMYRYERPQSGRNREFTQWGFEMFGSDSVEADAEVISLAYNAYKLLGLEDVKIKLNSLGDDESRNNYRKVLIDYFRPNIDKLCEKLEVRQEYIAVDYSDLIADAFTGRFHPCGRCSKIIEETLYKYAADNDIKIVIFGDMLATGSQCITEQSLESDSGKTLFRLNLPAALSVSKLENKSLTSDYDLNKIQGFGCPLLYEVHSKFPYMKKYSIQRILRETRSGALEPGEALDLIWSFYKTK